MKNKKKSLKNTFLPHLSWRDLLEWICLTVLIFFVGFCYHTIKSALLLTSSTLAFHETNWRFFMIVPAISLVIWPFILIDNIKQGTPVIPKIDPKRKYPKKQKEKIQHNRKVALIVFWTWAIITPLCLALSFFPRVVLLKNNTIEEVNVFNQSKVYMESENIKEYVVETYTITTTGHYRSTHYYISVTCVGDRKSEKFHISDFRNREEFFEYLYAKEDGTVFFKEGENHSLEPMDAYHLTQEERQFLQSLPIYQ